MITKEVNKFMALAPLMLPRLIDSKKCAEPDITEDSAILYFSLEEKFPIGCVMDIVIRNFAPPKFRKVKPPTKNTINKECKCGKIEKHSLIL